MYVFLNADCFLGSFLERNDITKAGANELKGENLGVGTQPALSPLPLPLPAALGSHLLLNTSSSQGERNRLASLPLPQPRRSKTCPPDVHSGSELKYRHVPEHKNMGTFTDTCTYIHSQIDVSKNQILPQNSAAFHNQAPKFH